MGGRLPRTSRFVFGLSLLLICGGMFWARETVHPSLPSPPSASWEIPTGLQDGDIILRRGTDLVADALIASKPGSRFSHVGVVLIEQGQPIVVHALPADATDDGVRREPIEQFLAPSQTADAALYRIPGLSFETRDRVRAYVGSRLDAPFDARLRFSDDSALYCTELVLKGFQAAGIDLTTTLPSIEMPTLPEPAFPPDAFRQIPGLLEIPMRRSVISGAFSHNVGP